jgi:outer membrane protein assembly factor BamA
VRARALPPEQLPPDQSYQDLTPAPNATPEAPAVVAAGEEEDDGGILIVPLLLYTPETHLGLGGLFVRFFRVSKQGDSRLSSIAALGIGTTRRQAIMELHHDLYFLMDSLHIFGKLEYQRYPDSFWGIGNAAEYAREERYDRERLRYRGSVQYRIYGPLYAGLGADLMLYRGVYATTNGIFATQDIPGERGGMTSGLGPTLTYDTRDNTISPSTGSLFNAALLFFGEAIGSDYGFLKSTLDLRKFFDLHPGYVLALRGRIEAHGGDVPYYQLALLGGDELLRGYYLGRYRDEALAALEVEYRYPIFWRFSGVAFAGAGAVAGAFDELEGVPIRWGVGGGLRFAVNRREKLNLRLDAGIGPDTFGAYFTVGEAF